MLDVVDRAGLGDREAVLVAAPVCLPGPEAVTSGLIYVLEASVGRPAGELYSRGRWLALQAKYAE